MKTKEELNILKGEYTELNKKLAALTEAELAQVTGGAGPDFDSEHVHESSSSAFDYSTETDSKHE